MHLPSMKTFQHHSLCKSIPMTLLFLEYNECSADVHAHDKSSYRHGHSQQKKSPFLLEYFPAPQSVQVEAPAATEYFPAPQSVQFEEPSMA